MTPAAFLAELRTALISYYDGILKVLRGITTFDEVFRVSKRAEE